MADLPLSCESIPIRIPGSIQPHGFLLAIDITTQRVIRASTNASEKLGRPLADILGQPWPACLNVEAHQLETLLTDLGDAPEHTVYPALVLHAQPYNVVTHISETELIVEFEDNTVRPECSLDALYPQIRAGIDRLQANQPIDALYALATELGRAMTGFDRVLIYRFDADWHGTVVGESRNGKLAAYFDLRFPASDIPAQARELYRLNRIRLIPNVDYSPVPIVNAPACTTAALDMTGSLLRSVAPVHREYMRNMGTAASMPISILRDDQLWGLIACHHTTPRQVSPQVRAACDFLSQIIAMQLVGKHRAADAAERVHRQDIQAALLVSMTQAKHFVDGLVCQPETLMALVDAAGTAVVLAKGVSNCGHDAARRHDSRTH